MSVFPISRNQLNAQLEQLRGKNDPQTLKIVTKEMESLFVYEMLKAMRQTTDSSSKNNFGASTYTSMFDMELAKVMADRGIGLQDMLLKALTKGAGTEVGNQRAGTSVSSINPVSNHRVSSGFGLRKDPFTGELRFHHGMDIAAQEGEAIHPFRSGKVVLSAEQGGFGNVVVVDHGDGYVSTYAHNKINLVHTGDEVTPETVIAQVGSTGRSTGPHVHFEVSRNGTSVDPQRFFGPEIIKVLAGSSDKIDNKSIS